MKRWSHDLGSMFQLSTTVSDYFSKSSGERGKVSMQHLEWQPVFYF